MDELLSLSSEDISGVYGRTSEADGDVVSSVGFDRDDDECVETVMNVKVLRRHAHVARLYCPNMPVIGVKASAKSEDYKR